jgi:hypothetical protein
VKVYHPLEVFLDLGTEKIKDKMRRKLSGLKKAQHNKEAHSVSPRPPNLTTGTFVFSVPFDMGERIALYFTNEKGDSRLTLFKNAANRIIYLTILPVLL